MSYDQKYMHLACERCEATFIVPIVPATGAWRRTSGFCPVCDGGKLACDDLRICGTWGHAEDEHIKLRQEMAKELTHDPIR